MTDPDRLGATTTDRGFMHMPPVESTYGGQVRVYESSAASGPHIWLKAKAPADLNHPEGPTVKASLHLRLADAARLADQLQSLVVHHYQNPPAANDGLFGPGIFGTGIDLSALDETTAYRLGAFVAQMVRRVEAQTWQKAIDTLRAKAAEGFLLAYDSAAGYLERSRTGVDEQPGPAMPVFEIKAKDALAPAAVAAYRDLCEGHDLQAQAAQVQLALDEIEQWQADHPYAVQVPDHQHVPAARS